MARRLFVGNLSYNATEAELHELFSTVGNCESVTLMTDRMTGRPRGFGFVEMSTEEEARRAIAQLDGKEIQGRNISVSEARERTAGGGPRSFGFAGGGGADSGGFSGRQRPPKEGGSRRGLRARRRSL